MSGKQLTGFGMMINKLKANPKKIVFTEGTDERILEAASRLLASNFLQPILVGNPDDVQAAARGSPDRFQRQLFRNHAG